MRKKDGRKWNVMLTMLLFMLTGCGGGTQETAPLDEQGAPVVTVRSIELAPLLEWEDPDSENLADMLQRECSGMMVQIEAGGHLGSGIIYGSSDNILLIVTAAHVLADAEDEVKITFADGWATESSDFSLWEQADLAQVRLAMEQIPEDRLKGYRAANVDRTSYDGVKSGDGCIVMGSRTGVAWEAYEGTVLDTWIYMEDYGHYMMWVKAYGKTGMSGGGLFDRKGHLLGVLSGISEDEEWAVVPLIMLLEGS